LPCFFQKSNVQVAPIIIEDSPPHSSRSLLSLLDAAPANDSEDKPYYGYFENEPAFEEPVYEDSVNDSNHMPLLSLPPPVSVSTIIVTPIVHLILELTRDRIDQLETPLFDLASYLMNFK
jgi:hypothetical protein